MLSALFLTALVSASPIVSSNGYQALCSDSMSKCDSIDLSKYLGTWYEIGRTKAITRVQGNDVCVQANYSLLSPSLVKVVNSSVRNGKPGSITGSALILSNSELNVSFFVPPMGAVPNYTIKNLWIDENGEYKRALIVGKKEGIEESEQSIWILARENAVSDKEIEESLDYATSAGFNPTASEWKRTEQVTCRS